MSRRTMLLLLPIAALLTTPVATKELPPKPSTGCDSVKSYNETLALSAFRYAAAAYKDDPQGCLGNATGDIVLGTFRAQCKNGTMKDTCFAYLAVNPTTSLIVLAVRGTTNVRQLYDEFYTYVQKETPLQPKGSVLQYFKAATDRLTEVGLIDAYRQTVAQYADYDIFITGHSLGGAIASLLSTLVALDDEPNRGRISLYTFGQPRVGDILYADLHTSLVRNSYRIVHDIDMIPHLPPCAHKWISWKGNCMGKKNSYYHHGCEIWYHLRWPNERGSMTPGTGHWTACGGRPYDEDANCSNSRLGTIMTILNVGDEFKPHTYYFETRVSTYCPKI